MAEETEVKYPEYVTDGHHIYIMHKEFAPLFDDGKLRACEAPVIPEKPALNAREQLKLEQLRQKALKDAEDAVRILSQSGKRTVETIEVKDVEEDEFQVK